MSNHSSLLNQFLPRFFIILTLCYVSACSNSSKYETVDHLQFQEPIVPLAIIDINVLSADGRTILPNRNVLIENGKISLITQEDIETSSVTVINGNGKYLIPGLVESHGHLQNSPNDLLVYVAHGVTYLREMGGKKQHIEWRDAIAKGRLGPKIYIARVLSSFSGLTGIYTGLFQDKVNYLKETQADDIIEQLVEDGYDAVKVSSFLSESMYLALEKAAKKRNLEFVGHIPYTVQLDNFWSHNLTEISHIEELTKAFDVEFGGYEAENAAEYIRHVKKRANEVALNVKRLGIPVHTTLWFMESLPTQALELERFINTVDLTFTNPQRSFDWMQGKNQFEASQDQKSDPETAKRIKIYWDTYVEAIHIMLDALLKHDVVLLAGSDSMTSMVVPGVSMHDELESLVKAGMSTAEALRSATLVPGEWMQSNTGKVSVGYNADLILLSENPLQDIKNTKKIESVILAGKVINKAKIDKILQSVRDVYDYSLID